MEFKINIWKYELIVWLGKRLKPDFIYCQSEIEGKEMCESQCDHCEDYYKLAND